MMLFSRRFPPCRFGRRRSSSISICIIDSSCTSHPIVAATSWWCRWSDASTRRPSACSQLHHARNQRRIQQLSVHCRGRSCCCFFACISFLHPIKGCSCSCYCLPGFNCSPISFDAGNLFILEDHIIIFLLAENEASILNMMMHTMVIATTAATSANGTVCGASSSTSARYGYSCCSYAAAAGGAACK